MLALGDLLKELFSGRSSGSDVDIDLGRFDDDRHDDEPTQAPVVAREGIWRESSYDLQRGLEVSEEPMDSMPAELVDVFRKPQALRSVE
jgi:hypothetical protein